MSFLISVKEVENIKVIYDKLFNEHEEVKQYITTIAAQLISEQKNNK